MAAFYQYPENLSEAELQNNGLFCLASEMSRQESIQAMSWLLLSAVIQVYMKKEQKVGQKVIRNVQFSEENWE